MTSPEHERPTEMSEADVTLVTRGITVRRRWSCPTPSPW